MFRFESMEYLAGMVVIPLLLATYYWGWFQKKRAMRILVSGKLEALLSPFFSAPKWLLRAILLVTVAFLLTITLMRPQGDRQTKVIKKRGRDLVFVLDVSRSMLAEDLKPNRLDRAKQLISDVLGVLEGDRVALLVFAGSTAIKAPLTLDYNYFRNALERVSVADIEKGGTLIGDAIRVVTDRLFYDGDNKYRDIILITDGEDHQSFPIEAAAQAAEKGVKIHTIGLGDPNGAAIPDKNEGPGRFFRYQNEVVRTKLDETTLKEIARITKGIFVPVRTNLVDLDQLYLKHIATEEKRESESQQSEVWSDLFQFFLGLAIILLLIESALGEGRLKSRSSRVRGTNFSQSI